MMHEIKELNSTEHFCSLVTYFYERELKVMSQINNNNTLSS